MATAQQSPAEAPEFHVVGIGASAGGITALRALIKAVPQNPALAFVVVQHLLPDQPSQLAALVERWTALAVCTVADGMRLQPDCIFVAPPGVAISLEGDVFATKPLDGSGPRAGIDTIDSFFESLAHDAGARAIGVILSGSGADGAAGAVRIRQAGGFVLVQDPTTAMHDGMPSAAIASGAADRILPPAALARELAACTAPGYERSSAVATWAHGVTSALDGIARLIRAKARFDLAGYKTSPLLWRIQRRMELRRVPLLSDYEALLRDDPVELEALIRGIPIHVTGFFRDPQAWDALERDVIPRLFAAARGDPVRTWTPACATGEEAYSLAILLAEHAARLERPADFQVFATDVAAEIVARASRGAYAPSALDPLSPQRRRRFFHEADGILRVRTSLRQKMVFATQDLLVDPPLNDLDLVTCRNLLIYLEPGAIARVTYQLHCSLRPGGFLLLGKGEALPAKQQGFDEIAPGARIYRKTGPASSADIAFASRPLRARRHAAGRNASTALDPAAAVRQDLPAVLTDAGFRILRFYGDTAPFLRFAPGAPTLNLPALLVPSLGAPLETAARAALARRSAVTVGGLADPVSGAATLALRITPLDTNDDGARLLVSFIRDPAAGADRLAAPPRHAAAPDWSEALRLSHAELDASREELQALNEELRASNDQLNLANEDLGKANVQLRGKIDELRTQSDVLSSGAVITLFLDGELRVQWFTPAIRSLFPLTAKDAGRRITDFAATFEDPSFLPDVEAVTRSGIPREGEFRAAHGNWYQRRILPFRAEGGPRAGTAITFSDVTERKRAGDARRRNEMLLGAQKDALQSAINGDPLAASLEFLLRCLVEQAGDCRCAFYIADAPGSRPRCVAGLPLSAAWQPAQGWSVPVATAAGKPVGSLVLSFADGGEPPARIRELAAALAQTAALLICRSTPAAEPAVNGSCACGEPQAQRNLVVTGEGE